MKDIEIKSVACTWWNSIVLKRDGELIGCGYNGNGNLGIGVEFEKRADFALITKNPSIKSLVSSSTKQYFTDKWSPEKHFCFPISFRISISSFLLCHKRIQSKTGLKIPKFVLYHIFQKIVL